MQIPVMTMKAPKHLLNATEVKTCRNGVKTYHVKILHTLIKSLNRILYFSYYRLCQSKKSIFYLKVLLGNNFPQFDKSQVSKLVKLFKLRQNQFLYKLFHEGY